MPRSLFLTAKARLEEEAYLPTAEQVERWQGRREAAIAWIEECDWAIGRLLGAPPPKP